MVIPTSFLVRYREQEAVVKRVQSRVASRLRLLCSDHNWLFEDRVKQPESVLAKLQLGEHRSIEDMNDFYATTVVVPTRAELEDAVKRVMASFGHAQRKPPRIRDPEAFVYDDAHVIAKLGSLGGNLEPPEVEQRAVEVQVRTGLQWAWWRGTHDVVYKGSDDWRLRRAAATVRAVLEGADRDLADLQALADRLAAPEGLGPDADDETVVAWQDRWPEGRRADDPRRFAETVRVYVRAGGLTVARVEALLDGDRGQELVGRRELTPAQAVLALVAEDTSGAVLEGLREEGRFVLVTDEMRTISGAFSSVSDDNRVRLEPGTGSEPASPR